MRSNRNDISNPTVMIVGSARDDGDTVNLARRIQDYTSWDIIDLNDYQIGHYDYNHFYKNDNYLDLIKKIVEEYDTILFVTPVYWYSMSGIMKVFFDRITDLLTIEKDLGRKLRGMNMGAISCSIGNNLGDNFWLPFRETANYLGMNYVGDLHTIAGMENDVEIQSFVESIDSMINN